MSAPTTSLAFNEQQEVIIGAAEPGGPQIIIGNALAGTGKSTTLKGMAGGPLRHERVGYFVFNKRNADEAAREFPSNVTTKTAHSFAFGARHPDDRRHTMMQVYAKHLVQGSLYGPLREKADDDPRFFRHVMAVADKLRLQRGQALMAIQGTLRHYCQSVSARVAERHVPAELKAHLERERIPLSACSALVEATAYVFDRMRDPTGGWPVDHGLYLKLYSLDPGRIAVDTIMFDEGQDANPPMLQILKAQIQHGTRLVLVGDTYQHIYDFTGAVDAMSEMRKAHKAISNIYPLTISYRFGQGIADSGNRFLRLLSSPYFLEGRGPDGEVNDDPVTDDEGLWTTLYRTNMALLTDAVEHIAAGRRVHVVGGVAEAVRLMEGMGRMYMGDHARHPELAFFADWKELEDYAETEEGGTVRPMVRLVVREKGNIGPLVAALERTEDRPDRADQTLCTAHKSKGGQWDRVRLSQDFHRAWEPDVDKNGREIFVMPDESELSLQYVAATRAQKVLHTNGLFSVMNYALSKMTLPETQEPETRASALAASAR